MSERKHVYEAGTTCWCGESAPSAPPAAHDSAKSSFEAIRWAIHTMVSANWLDLARITTAATDNIEAELARAESELEKLRIILQEYERESPKHGGDGWDIRFRLKVQAALSEKGSKS